MAVYSVRRESDGEVTDGKGGFKRGRVRDGRERETREQKYSVREKMDRKEWRIKRGFNRGIKK